MDGDTNPTQITMDSDKEVTATFIYSNMDPVVSSLNAWGYPGGPLDPAGSVTRGSTVRI